MLTYSCYLVLAVVIVLELMCLVEMNVWRHAALLTRSADQTLHCLHTCSTSNAVLAVANYNRNIWNFGLEPCDGGKRGVRLACRTLDRLSAVDIVIIIITAIDLSLGGSSPYTGTDRTIKNKYT